MLRDPSPNRSADALARHTPCMQRTVMQSAFTAQPPTGGRLNLLLSYGGWQRDSWAEALPRLLEPLGVSSLRAGTAAQARDVIQRYPIHIAVVDLEVPLGGRAADAEPGGCRILELLSRLDAPPPTVVVKRARSHRDDRRDICAALRAGAFAVLDQPRTQRDTETLLEVLRRCLLRHYRGVWPGPS